MAQVDPGTGAKPEQSGAHQALDVHGAEVVNAGTPGADTESFAAYALAPAGHHVVTYCFQRCQGKGIDPRKLGDTRRRRQHVDHTGTEIIAVFRNLDLELFPVAHHRDTGIQRHQQAPQVFPQLAGEPLAYGRTLDGDFGKQLDDKMHVVANHKRLYGKNKESMVWGPYLDILAQRPNALRYSGFFNNLPDPVRQFLNNCDLEGKKQILKLVSQISKEKGMDNSISALTDAIKLEPKDADTLISAYSFVLNKPEQVVKNYVPEYIPDLTEYKIDFAAYANLMGGGTCKKK